MTGLLRGALRALAVVGFLAIWALAFGIARPFLRGARRETWRRSFFMGACRGLLVVFGARLRVEGSFPSNPGFLVTNHLGYLDVLVLGGLGPTVFVSRDDVEGWPWIGPLTRWAGTIYLDRSQKSRLRPVIDAMEAAMRRGNQVVFFPEGTSGSGGALLPFRASLFEAAARTAAPVHCATIHYATAEEDDSPSNAVAWWGDMEFLPHAWRMLRLRRIDVVVRFSTAEIQHDDRKAIAGVAEREVEALFVPLAGAPAAEAKA